MKRAVVFVLFPLVLGALAYFALREPNVRIHDWAAAIGLGSFVSFLHRHAPHLPGPIAGSLPDASWAFAFGAALSLVWRGKKSRLWLFGGAAITMSLELGQAVHVVPGVFDPIDLVSMTAAYFIAWRICQADISWMRRRDAAPASPK